jgi:hypothetical protein
VNNDIENNENKGKKPFVKPELKILDIKDTQTGGTPDPNEFNPFLNKS